MRVEFFWAVVVSLWIFGWVTVWLIRRRDEESRAMKLRELVHKERMTALDKGVPLPEIPVEDEPVPPWLRPETDRLRAIWLGRVALALGLLSFLGGLGMCAAFYWAPDRGFRDMWTLGFIPAMAGLGFLLYFVLTRAERGEQDA